MLRALRETCSASRLKSIHPESVCFAGARNGPLALGNGLARAVLGLLALFNKSVEYSFKLLSFTGIWVDFL
jgi:hypothetical protein